MFTLGNMITCGFICLMVGGCLGMIVIGLVSGNTWEDGYSSGFNDGKKSNNIQGEMR